MTIIIKNGLIVDGSGSSGYVADLLIEGEEIKKIGKNLDSEGSKVYDASNKVVAPGFIDIHNHSDLTLFQSLKVEPYILQGCTTLAVGMCGLGVVPSNEKVREFYFKNMNKDSFTHGLYKDLPEYWKEIENQGGVSINLAFFIPQGNVRAYILGAKERAPSKEELTSMKEIVRENMKAGAFGMSTGLVYPPGSVSSTDELIELSKVVAEYDGLYDSHMRNEGAKVIEVGMNEIIEIARKAKVRAHISHWSVISKFAYDMTPDVIEHLKKARGEGLEITADTTVYPDGATNLALILLKPWVFEDLEHNLTDTKTREKIIDEVFEKVYDFFFADAPFYIKLIPNFLLRKLIFRGLAKTTSVITAKNNTKVEGKMLYEIFNEIYPDKKLEEALLDFIRDEEGNITIRVQTKNEEKSIIPIFNQDFVAPSSDGFLEMEKNTHPRSYGAFARVLQRWVREMEIVSLEEAIRKMTSLPASILQIPDRGLLKPGFKADIVVFDKGNIEEKGTIQNGRQHPVGIDFVFVNGKLTGKERKHSGSINGKILKHKKIN
jgi:N-acyl-D-amino-acid deacylase